MSDPNLAPKPARNVAPLPDLAPTPHRNPWRVALAVLVTLPLCAALAGIVGALAIAAMR